MRISVLPPAALNEITTMSELARVLRQLRRREARRRGGSQLTYRDLAVKTGWSHGIVGEYLGGRILPPPDKFDVLITLLGAGPAEQGVLATFRDRVEERSRITERPAGAVGWAVVPRQLPTDVSGFAGRSEALARLDAVLAAEWDSPAVVVISGPAGVGKTALAVHWSHLTAERFHGGQLYVNLRGFEPGREPMTPSEAVRGFLDALRVPTGRIPVDLAAQAALYRDLVTGLRLLVVLDNARDAAQVRPLLPGSAGCLVVVTSRDHLTGLAGPIADHLTLDLLSPAEARDLLASRLGQARVAAEAGAVDEIVTRCARLPLALSIAAARGAAHPGFALAALAGELRQAGSGLDAFDGGDPLVDVRSVFSWSYQRLGLPARRLFRLLGLHPGPDISAAAAASLAGVPPGPAHRLLIELSRAHLVAEPVPGRFAFHDLLRACAAELGRAVDDEADRRAAVRRMLDHYLHTAAAAATLADPHRDPIPLTAAAPGVAAEHFTGAEPAARWFMVEHPVLIAVLYLAADLGFDSHTCRLSRNLTDHFRRQGHWYEWAATHEVALTAAGRSADPAGLAAAHRALAGAYSRLGRYDDAHAQLRRAVELFAELGDDLGQAATHMSLSWLFGRQDRYPEALAHAELALDRYRRIGQRAGQAKAFNTVGWYHALLGAHRQALSCCEEALRLQREVGDRAAAGNTWDSLGYAHHQLGNHRLASECYRRAIELFQEFEDRYYEADSLSHLGDAERSLGDLAAARAAWRLAVDILERLGHADAELVRAKLRDLSGP